MDEVMVHVCEIFIPAGLLGPCMLQCGLRDETRTVLNPDVVFLFNTLLEKCIYYDSISGHQRTERPSIHICVYRLHRII